MGQCFYSKDLGIVVTDLQWLSDMFKGLITFQNRWVKDGIVLRQELNHVWKNSSDAEIEENMKLLETFHIAFPKTEEGKWVIPCMLNDGQKGAPFDFAAGTLRYERIFKIESVPAGLIGRLIVRMQNQPNISIKELWRTGMIFELKDTQEEGEIVLDGNDIRIRCKSWKAGQKPVMIRKVTALVFLCVCVRGAKGDFC